MKLLVVSRQAAFSEGIGGMERAVADQVTDFLDLGIDVRLVVPDSDALGALPLGLTCVSVPWPGWNKGGGRPTYGLAYLFWCMRLRKWLDQNVFHDESILFHGASVGSLTSRLANDHFVVSNPHGMEEFKFSILRWPNRVFIRALSRRGKLASKIVSTDRSLTPVVQKNLGCDLDKIILIPNSVNVPYLDRCSQNASKDRDTFSIAS
jgi:hypothetical protein